MKRTKIINRALFRKKTKLMRLTPIALGLLAASSLIGCEQKDANAEALTIYGNVEECVRKNPHLVSECEASFDRAVKEAETTAPKYASLEDCQAEFGADGCQSAKNTEQSYRSGGGMWMPLLAGYMFGRMQNNQFANKPLYAPKVGKNAGKFFDSAGKPFGQAVTGRNVSVAKNDLKPTKASANTLKRGGFGQVVAQQNARMMSQSKSNNRSGAKTPTRSYGG